MNKLYSTIVSRKALLCFLAILGFPALVVSGPEFIAVTTPAFATAQQPNMSWGNPIWGDIDGDGKLDLLIIPTNDTDPLVYLYTGGDNFQRILKGTSPGMTGIDPPSDYGTDWRGFAFGDYDGDGRLDLFIAINSDGTVKSNLLFKGNGKPSPTQTYFSQVTTTPFDSEKQQGQTGFWVDSNNNGKLELFVKNYFASDIHPTSCPPPPTLGNRLYEYSNTAFGNDSIDPVLKCATLIDGGSGHGTICSFEDYDLDRDMDVAFSRLRKQLYRKDPTAYYQTSYLPADPNESTTGIAWGDYDNDGYPDLFIATGSFTSPQNLGAYLFHNNGAAGGFTPVTGSPLNTNYNTWGAVWGDYDNDGDLDLFVACSGMAAGINATGNSNFLFRNKGLAFSYTFENVAAQEPAIEMAGHGWLHKGAAWADYNNDGFLDLVVKDGIGSEMGITHLVKNVPNGNHWIEVALTGRFPALGGSNVRGIGARVEVDYGSNKIYRQNNGGGGGEYDSQGSEPLHFGLGPDATSATIIVTWPNGRINTVPAQIDQLNKITEPLS